jgi:hypothetical protein
MNATGEEFGLKSLQAELQKYGKEPLDVICRSLQERVARHGKQFDDQSLLLIRPLKSIFLLIGRGKCSSVD